MQSPTQPRWDAQLAQRIVGSKILIGITLRDPDQSADAPGEQLQMHGVVISADPKTGFEVKLQGNRAGETYALPPDPQAIEEAQPGEYRLRCTGEIVIDPDFVSTWNIWRGWDA